MPSKLPRHIEYRPLDQITPAQRNAKQHDPHIGTSIDELGYIEPMIEDGRTGRLVAGHGRLEQLQAMFRARESAPDGIQVRDGKWFAPVTVGWSSKDDTQAEAANLVLNRLTERAGWDDDVLGKMLADQPDTSWLGWDEDELAALLGGPGDLSTVTGMGGGLGGDPDEVPEVPREVTVLGDVWTLGRHRLMCGDSTKPDTYIRLLGGEKPVLLVTDPPYGVAYQSAGSDKRAILGDLSQATIPVSLAASLQHLDDNARLLLFGGSDQFAMYLSLWDFHLRQQPRLIVWVKEGFVLRHHGFHSQYELAYYGWKGTGGSAWWGDRTTSDVWSIPRMKETDHGTEKPVALFEIPVSHLAGPGESVLDPFAGSGVAVIAAERTGRTCWAVERDPHWCDVICKRFQLLTGEMPARENGEPVDFVGAGV